MTDPLRELIAGHTLAEADAEALLERLTDPRTEAAWTGAVLAALQVRGPTADEVRGFARGMRGLAHRVDTTGRSPTVDIVGTGGDGSGSLNLSTGGALLAAACGLPVVKHGNRGISSQSGSSDVLEALGYALPEDPAAAVDSLDRLGFTFLHAPHFHPAMRSVAPVRRAMAVRTVFNILGPLTNPGSPSYYVIGAYDPDVARLMAEALSGMEIDRAFVVHGDNGWDEATPVCPYLLLDVRPGRVEESTRDPRDLGLPAVDESDLRGGNATYNANAIRDAFEGGDPAHRAALALTAGLALEVTGRAPTIESAVVLAGAALEDGSARSFLERLS